MKYPRRASVYFIKSLVISIFIQFQTLQLPEPSAPLDIRSCIRKSRGCADAASCSKSRHPWRRFIRPVVAANLHFDLLSVVVFLSDRNSLLLTMTSHNDFYRQSGPPKLDPDLVDLSWRASSNSSRKRFAWLPRVKDETRCLHVTRLRFRERSTNRWSFLGNDDYDRHDPRADSVLRSERQASIKRKREHRNSMLRARNKTRSCLVFGRYLSTIIEIHERAYVCETRLAVTSFFTYSGLRRKIRFVFYAHRKKTGYPIPRDFMHEHFEVPVPSSLVISVLRNKGLHAMCNADFLSWSRVTSGTCATSLSRYDSVTKRGQ